jgi:uncharacterized protein YjiS (DUF1127 family)
MADLAHAELPFLRHRAGLRLGEMLALWHRRASSRANLARLDADGLADIGLTPLDVRTECMKPFWMA